MLNKHGLIQRVIVALAHSLTIVRSADSLLGDASGSADADEIVSILQTTRMTSKLQIPDLAVESVYSHARSYADNFDFSEPYTPDAFESSTQQHELELIEANLQRHMEFSSGGSGAADPTFAREVPALPDDATSAMMNAIIAIFSWPSLLAFVAGCCAAASFGPIVDRLGLRQKTQAHSALHKKGESVEWLNDLFSYLWPSIDTAVRKSMKENVAPLLAATLPGLSLDEFTLGEFAPSLGPIKVQSLEPGARMKVFVDYKSDVIINLSWGIFTFGLRELRLAGCLVINFTPLLSESQGLAGVQVYFLDPPRMDMDFTGLANIADAPGVAGKVRRAVQDALNGFLVLPNILGVPIADQDEVCIATPEPLGVLRVAALRGQGLRAMDYNLFSQHSSDPYVEVCFGDTVWCSSVVDGTCDPTWLRSDVTDLLVFDGDQRIRIQVHDRDSVTKDDLIGYCESLSVSAACSMSGKSLPLFHRRPDVLEDSLAHFADDCTKGGSVRTEGDQDCGALTMLFDYMPLGPAQASKRSDGRHVISALVNHAFVRADVAQNVSKLFVRVTLGTSMAKTTRAGKPTKGRQLDAAQKEAMEDMIRRLHEQGVAAAPTAAAAGLRTDQVEAICRFEEVEWTERVDAAGPAGRDSDFRSTASAVAGSTDYTLQAALHFIVEGDEAAFDTPLKIELLKEAGGVAWMEASTTLGDALTLREQRRTLPLAGAGARAKLDLRVAMRPLTTAAMDSPRDLPGCFPSALGCFKTGMWP